MIKSDREHSKHLIREQLDDLATQIPTHKKSVANSFSVLFLITISSLVILFFVNFGIFTVSNTLISSTFAENDLIIYNRMSHNYEKDDTMIFKAEIGQLAQRVIATPGDVVEFIDDSIFVNHDLIISNYTFSQDSGIVTPYILHNEEFFVLADPIEDKSLGDDFFSSDPISIVSSENIIGKVFFIIRPLI